MTWTVKVKYTRPNTDVAFYKAAANTYLNNSDQNHQTSTYKDTGKLISTSASLSDNELEIIKTFVYKDEASKDEHLSDSVIQTFRTADTEYNEDNDITRVILQNEAT